MRTWTAMAAALLAATAGISAAALYTGDQPAVQVEQKRKVQSGDTKDDGEGPRREVRRVEVLTGGSDMQIGAAVKELDAEQAKTTSGVVVTEVRSDSPAAKAGITQGDVIVAFDGEKVRSARHLRRLVDETAPGRAVTASLVRGGKKVDVQVTPEEGRMARGWGADDMHFKMEGMPGFEMRGGPDMVPFRFERRGPGGEGDRERFDVFVAPGRGRLGIGVQELTPQLAEYFGTKDGVLVTSVQQDSPAAKAGLRAGDVITAVGDKPVTSPSEVTRAVREADTSVSIGYTRDKKSATTTATLEPRERPRSPRPI